MRGHGQALRRESPQRWHPSTPRKTNVVVQQGSQLRPLASPAGLVAYQGNTMALSDICILFCGALPEELGTSAQLLPYCQCCGSGF